MKSMDGFSLIEVIIAIGLSSLIFLSLFEAIATIETVYQQQFAMTVLQQKMRFLNLFFREKIESAGDFSCEPDREKPRSITIHKYTASQALQKLGLAIKPKTDLLQMHLCVRFADQRQYLPVDFFVENTFRVDNKGREIDALFMKIDHHPREELVTNVNHFRVDLDNVRGKKNDVSLIRLSYVLISHDAVFKTNNPYFFNGKWITPVGDALYEPGEIDVARRLAILS